MLSILKNLSRNTKSTSKLNLYKNNVLYDIYGDSQGLYLFLMTLCYRAFESEETVKKLLKEKIKQFEDINEDHAGQEFAELVEEIFENRLGIENIKEIIEDLKEHTIVVEDLIIELIDRYQEKSGDEFKQIVAHLANALGMELSTFKRIWMFIEAYYNKSNQLLTLAEEVKMHGPAQLLPMYTTTDNAFSYQYVDNFQAILCNVDAEQIAEWLLEPDENVVDVTLVNCHIDAGEETLLFTEFTIVNLINCHFTMHPSKANKKETVSNYDLFMEEYGQQYVIEVEEVEQLQIKHCSFKSINMPIINAETDSIFINHSHFENIHIDSAPCIYFEGDEVHMMNNKFNSVYSHYENVDEDNLYMSTLCLNSYLDIVTISNNDFKKCQVTNKGVGKYVAYILDTDEKQIENNQFSSCDQNFYIDRG